MGKKKKRSFFICPRWAEIAHATAGETSGAPPVPINEKTLAAIKAGQPVARSTLRKALLTARAASGSTFDVDVYIVDGRVARSR
jgi:hypothetical protein